MPHIHQRLPSFRDFHVTYGSLSWPLREGASLAELNSKFTVSDLGFGYLVSIYLTPEPLCLRVV